MHPIPRSCLLTFAAVLLLAAAGPSWKNKPVAQWDDRDAQQFLADSPWVKATKLDQIRDLSVDERRQGGNMSADSGHGVGLAGIDIFSSSTRADAIARAHAHPDPGTVVVRWESALPVRAAELKAGETNIPNWKGDYYALAVYGIDVPARWNMANELKGVAFLQRDKKKNLKPVHVDILRQDDGLATVVYLFSRSNEITRKDNNIRFVAQIGRLFVSQFFFPAEMQFEGNPEF
jgi:hypothetical protein